MKLLSYSQVILETRRRMNRYVDMDKKSRALYNSIEKKWNELYGLVVDRLDTKLIGKQVPHDHPVFEPAIVRIRRRAACHYAGLEWPCHRAWHLIAR